MSSIRPASAPVNATADSKPAKPKRVRLAGDALALRRRIVAAECQWNRDVGRLLGFIQKVMLRIDEVTSLDARQSILDAWRAAGLPRLRDDDEANTILDLAAHVGDEINGLHWALSAIESVLSCQTAASDRDPRDLW